MKNIVLLSLLFISTISVQAQENANLKNGYAVQGYDVVAYFQDKVEKGNAEFYAVYNDIKYKFYTKDNLVIFQKNPEKYIPQYGGYCAYAIAKNGKKVSVNPKTYTIIDGKLYLFFNSWGTNTLKKWNAEGPELLQKQANTNWLVIINNK